MQELREFLQLGNPVTTIFQMRTPARMLFVACLMAVLACGGALAAGETLFVTVKKTSIRSARQFYAPSLGEAVFRDKLVVLGREKDWVRVRGNGVEGWVHRSATAAGAVSVSEKQATAGVSQEDVAFASKGFDATVEREYAKGKTPADFAAVDRMEQLGVSEKALAEFRKEGNLKAGGDQR